MPRHTEGLPTLVTFIRLLFCISPHCKNCLSTMFTFIWLITCVIHHVVLEMARMHEFLPTSVTFDAACFNIVIQLTSLAFCECLVVCVVKGVGGQGWGGVQVSIFRLQPCHKNSKSRWSPNWNYRHLITQLLYDQFTWAQFIPKSTPSLHPLKYDNLMAAHIRFLWFCHGAPGSW